MTNNGTMPAMPCEVVEQYHIEESQVPSGAPTLRERKVMSVGMTKREMMAMHMMCAMIGAPVGRVDIDDGEQLPLMAIVAADALLAELERTK